MSKYSELMEEAKSGGIEFDAPQTEGQPNSTVETSQQTDANPSASSPDNAVDSANGAANTDTATPEKLPYHKDPELQKYIEKMTTKNNREWEERIRQVEDMYRSKLEALAGLTGQKPKGEELTPEQDAAANQLASILRARMGLDKYDQTHEQLSSLQEEREREVFTGELKSVVSDISGKYGLKADEFEAELQEYIENDPHYSNAEYSKGLVAKAARDFLFDRVSELKEREINSRLIKEKQAKQSQNVETQGKAGASGAKPVDLSIKGAIADRIRQAGGLDI